VGGQERVGRCEPERNDEESWWGRAEEFRRV
jgi:hypothetical protein